MKKVTIKPKQDSPANPINAKIAVANAEAPITPYPGLAMGKAEKRCGSDQKYFSIPNTIHILFIGIQHPEYIVSHT